MTGGEDSRVRIQRLIAEGKLAPDLVAHAEELWSRQWQDGIVMPNGWRIRVTLDDLYHLIVDSRIARKPERIDLMLRHVYEIREARDRRHRILSRWRENAEDRHAFGILAGDRLWTAHLIMPRDLQKYQDETVLWRR